MADADNNPSADLCNAQIELKTLIYEIRKVLEALTHGFKTLMKRPEADALKRELGILENFVTQIIDALEAYEEPLRLLTTWPKSQAEQA
ncbi:MAG: hypothetical protein HC850_18230 [Rhodomicrobium sp.]|nr:hypothetical protein [Rhodomicrobium sp.]